MFVKKLVEKASLKKPEGSSDGLKPNHVDPRVIFHYGVPSGATLLAYDSIQKIFALSTKDGRIKLYGKNGAQVLLESSEMAPYKFLQFSENQGILVTVIVNNHIEVWDITQKLSHVLDFKREITSVMVMQHTPYMFVGDVKGNVSVLKLGQEPLNIEPMKYHVPCSASRGENLNEAVPATAVCHIMPQPAAESKRVLIIYTDGLMTLWAIQESKAIYTVGGTALQSLSHETKKVTAACWACPYGSKVVVGYDNGEIFIWAIPVSFNSKAELTSEKDSSSPQSAPLSKLNLGYKLDKIPIAKLRWDYADGKVSRLYVLGSSDHLSANLLQVVLLNGQTETRIVKLGLHPPESCVDMEIISDSDTQSKSKNNSFLLLGKSGHIYSYDDFSIERYLIQCQSKSPPSLPREIMVQLPFSDSSITIAKFVTDNPYMLCSADQDYNTLAKDRLPIFPFEMTQKDGSVSSTSHFTGLSKAKNLYITGHSSGAINIWDVSCPILVPLVSLTQQSEDDLSLSGVSLTALYASPDLQILISGDESGTVRIYRLKKDSLASVSSFLSLSGGSKKGGNHIIHSVKVLKVNGAVLSIDIGSNPNHIAVGSEQGNVSLIDLEGPTILYQRHIASELSPDVISVQSETCNLHGFDKNVLVVATKDSSVSVLETNTGNPLSSSMIRPKKPSRALFMEILDDKEQSGQGSTVSDGVTTSKRSSDDVLAKQQFLLLCAEKAIYTYSLVHAVQGIKKVHYKKKFHSSSCIWASTFHAPLSGLILLLSSGKIEIRSLPDLSLLKETSVRGLKLSTSKPNTTSSSSICSSYDGELIVVDGDQEIFFISTLFQRHAYRFLDGATQVYDKDLTIAQGPDSPALVHQEKKKGIFSSIIRDSRGTKGKNGPHMETEEARVSIEELSLTFSAANFPTDAEIEEKSAMNEDDLDLDIDDIDLEDTREKPKGHPMIAALSKQNFTNKFQAFKGKLKNMTIKNEKVPVNEAQHDEKAGTVDDIKKRYGYSSSSPSGEQSAANIAKTKLSENLKKLQGINARSAEMQDSAQSFSAMAKQVLRLAENDKRNV